MTVNDRAWGFIAPVVSGRKFTHGAACDRLYLLCVRTAWSIAEGNQIAPRSRPLQQKRRARRVVTINLPPDHPRWEVRRGTLIASIPASEGCIDEASAVMKPLNLMPYAPAWQRSRPGSQHRAEIQLAVVVVPG